MVTISHAQNCEDIVLDRLFKTKKEGRYLDVGAGDPDFESVTKLFYERGWRGINVEPNPTLYERLKTARPGDLNLQVALSDKPGRANLYSVTQTRRPGVTPPSTKNGWHRTQICPTPPRSRCRRSR